MNHRDAPLSPNMPEPAKGGFQATWLYRQLLRGKSPKGVRCQVAELWPGDPERGRAQLTGEFHFNGESHHLTSAAGLPENASAEWLAWFHGHGWLTHLQALGGGEAPISHVSGYPPGSIPT